MYYKYCYALTDIIADDMLALKYLSHIHPHILYLHFYVHTYTAIHQYSQGENLPEVLTCVSGTPTTDEIGLTGLCPGLSHFGWSVIGRVLVGLWFSRGMLERRIILVIGSLERELVPGAHRGRAVKAVSMEIQFEGEFAPLP